MNEIKRKQIIDKNQKIIDMVVEKAKTKYPEDVDLIGLTGSFATGDFYEKSDLDLVIIINNDRGWGVSYTFILDDVGYDIYCTSWESGIKGQSNLDSVMISGLVDLQIVYVAKPEYMDKFNLYKQRSLDILNEPIGERCLNRASKSIDIAKQNYADMILLDDLGKVRYSSYEVVYNLIEAITHINNTYIKRGIKRIFKGILEYEYIPENFEEIYLSIIDAVSVEEIKETTTELLKNTIKLFGFATEKFFSKPKATYDNLKGTYEELWSNYMNKVIDSIDSGNKSYAYNVAMDAQNFLNEMSMEFGTQNIDIARDFNSSDLHRFKDAFLKATDNYLNEYKKVGRTVERFDSFEDLYDKYMGDKF